jgi:hypothetical protein
MASYIVQSGDSLSKIARHQRLTLNALLALNPEFKANPNDLEVGDALHLSSPSKPKKPAARPPSSAPSRPPATGDFEVPRGQLTFDSEGMENPGGRYHSRVLHVPTSSSGATIGRGYDMKERSKDEIGEDMLAAFLHEEGAKKLAGLGGLVGSAAEARIARNGLRDLEISSGQQKTLFLLTYDELAGDVKRICRKADVVAKYGPTDWGGLDPTIKDVLVDLRYRGDYTGATRQKLQRSVAQNDLTKLRDVVCNESFWMQRGVPRDRFERRRDFVLGPR